jgi:hypothetical protein
VSRCTSSDLFYLPLRIRKLKAPSSDRRFFFVDFWHPLQLHEAAYAQFVALCQVFPVEPWDGLSTTSDSVTRQTICPAASLTSTVKSRRSPSGSSSFTISDRVFLASSLAASRSSRSSPSRSDVKASPSWMSKKKRGMGTPALENAIRQRRGARSLFQQGLSLRPPMLPGHRSPGPSCRASR